MKEIQYFVLYFKYKYNTYKSTILDTKDIKLKIVKMHLEEGVTLRELSEQFHIHPSKSSIRWICIGDVS